MGLDSIAGLDSITVLGEVNLFGKKSCIEIISGLVLGGRSGAVEHCGIGVRCTLGERNLAWRALRDRGVVGELELVLALIKGCVEQI